MTHISSRRFVHCHREAGWDKTRVLISHSAAVASQVRAENIVQNISVIDGYTVIAFALGIIIFRANSDTYRLKLDLKGEQGFVYQRGLSGVATSNGALCRRGRGTGASSWCQRPVVPSRPPFDSQARHRSCTRAQIGGNDPSTIEEFWKVFQSFCHAWAYKTPVLLWTRLFLFWEHSTQSPEVKKISSYCKMYGLLIKHISGLPKGSTWLAWCCYMKQNLCMFIYTVYVKTLKTISLSFPTADMFNDGVRERKRRHITFER